MPDKAQVIEHFEFLHGLLTTFAAAIIGRLMWHTEEVQRGNRSFWSVALIWELPTCIGMAFVGKGIAQYFNLGEWAEVALIATLSYLGPRGLKAVLRLWLLHRGKLQETKS